ncbi:MAG: hypothetical protein NTX84_11885 [Nitrospirae bacterium]|nr:hypothetical protein [Nitrospirota bacterium]
MNLFRLVALMTFVAVTGCSHMDGVVREISFNKDGDLVVRKCDEKIYWDFYFIVWGEGDCREEVKPAPVKVNS